MNRIQVMVVAGALLLAAACGKKAPSASMPGKGHPHATDALWALAPQDAVAGAVVSDGVAARVLADAAIWTARAERHPMGKTILVRLRSALTEDGGFLLDPETWRRRGLDPARGAAVFFAADLEAPRIWILPVSDRAAYRAAHGGKVQKVDGLEVDVFGDRGVCGEIAGRYVCAADAATLGHVSPSDRSPLATAVRELAAEERGDAELYVRAEAVTDPGLREFLEEIRPGIDGVKAFVASARLEPDGLLVRAWLRGKPTDDMLELLRPATSPPALRAALADAVGVMRLHLHVRRALGWMPPSVPIGGIDLRADLLERLGGDFLLVTPSGPPAAGLFATTTGDPAALGPMIEKLCSFFGSAEGVRATFSHGACEVSMNASPNDSTRIAAHDNLLYASVGDFGPAGRADGPNGAPGDLAGSADTRRVLEEPASLAMWSRGFDFATGIKPILPQLSDLIDREAGIAALDFASWLGLHIYDVGLAARVEGDGVRLLFRVTTFGGTPGEARAAYEAALERRLAGDRSGYRAALEALVQKHGNTLVGRQAALELRGYLPIGVGTSTLAAVAIPAFVKYVRKSKTAEAVLNVKRLWDGARVAGLASRKFPASTPLTPPAGSCCQQPSGQCTPDPALWTHPTWKALGFSLNEPHHYSYQLESDGQRFTVRALGDLDCDGVYSTFEMVGRFEGDEVVGGEAFYRNREIE